MKNKITSTHLSIFIITFWMLLLPINAWSVATALDAESKSNATWEAFRNAYPFHIQVTAITNPFPDGSRVLLISEPPPHLDISYFQNTFVGIQGKVLSKKKQVGYDGWVKDVVISLPNMDEERLANILSELQFDLFGTTYKAQILQLPLSNTGHNSSLDLSISIADLHRWTKQATRFEPLEGGAGKRLENLLSNNDFGVFLSEEPGLVVWSIPRFENLKEYTVEGRQFFLDSDLILGAIADEDQVVIVGRERVESLLRLPPLRMESVLLLAAEESGELSQSYERNHIFAGKLKSKQDWAPIYLSDILINTEFGSLLNITDQMLKSWSMNGTIKYVNFDYPDPGHWPPFKKSLKSVLDERGSILFNWNTSGVGYTTFVDQHEYLALYRTGALPITYLAGSEEIDEPALSVHSQEETAYNYFAGLNNPDLARVVQYTALFQIFTAFDIASDLPHAISSSKKGDDELRRQALSMLKKIINLSDSEFEEIVVRHVEAYVRDLEAAGLLKDRIAAVRRSLEDDDSDDESIEELINLTLQFQLYNSLSELRVWLEKGETFWPGEALPQLAGRLAAPRNYEVNLDEQSLIGLDDKITQFLEDEDDFFEALSANQKESLKEIWVYAAGELMAGNMMGTLKILQDIELIKNNYVSAFSDDVEHWVKTASIVLSRDVTSDTGTGGHNLSSVVTKLHPSSGVQRGRVQILDDALLYNPQDVGKIHSLSRALVARNYRTQTQLVEALESTMRRTSVPARSISDALHVPQNKPVRGYLGGTNALNKPSSWRWRNAGQVEKSEMLVSAELPHSSLIIERNANGYVLMQPNNPRVIEAHTLTNLHEVLGKAMRAERGNVELVNIHMKGFSAEEARSLMQTAQLRDRGIGNVLPNGTVRSHVTKLNRQYDWSKANILQKNVKTVTEGKYRGYQEHTVDVSLTLLGESQPSLFMRIIAYVKGALPEGLINTVRRVLQKSNLSQQPSELQNVLRDLRKEINTRYPGTHLEIRTEAPGSGKYDEGLIIADILNTNFYAPHSTYQGP